MCLLVMLAQAHPALPLVVAANRDELLDRPAVAMTVLRESGPRVLGGRDQLAGGTWLAVNDAGVVAGLTNRPTPGGRDLAKRSRGELPLLLAGHTSAAAAVEAFAAAVRPPDYNPAWLLVGDRHTAYEIDVTGEGDEVEVTELAPGVHVLENRPMRTASPKSKHVRSLLTDVAGLDEEPMLRRLQAALGDHVVPPRSPDDETPAYPPEIKAACVHTERYGTRSSSLVTVPADHVRPPTVRYADGPACSAEWCDATALWCEAPSGSR